MRLRPLITVVALLGALSLTACDDTGSSAPGAMGDPATPSGSPSAAEPSLTPSAPSPSLVTPSPPATTDPGSTGAGATPPGTTLKYGEPAVVEVYASGNPKAQVEYTVTGVKMSTKQQALGPTALITIEVRAIDDLTNALALALIDWEGVDEFGNTTVFGIDEGCDDELPVEKAGETGTMCVAVSLTGDGTRLTAVQYGSGAYRDNPITWKP